MVSFSKKTVALFTFFALFSAFSARLITDPDVCLEDTECGGAWYCDTIQHKCARRSGIGASCFDSNECREHLFCSIDGKCEKKKKIGDSCNPFTGSPCEGGAECDFDLEKCVASPPKIPLYGAPCERDSECIKPVDDLLPDGAPPVVCNVPKGSNGLCLNPNALIKVLGANCSPSRDACDARRGLSCQFSSKLRRDVCMQMARFEDFSVSRFCTPDSDLSRCENRNGIPTVCRLGRLGFEDISACEPRQEVLKAGQACFRGNIGVCADGLECKLIPSVLTRHRPTWMSCVKVVGRGESCSDIFTTQCGDELKCENNVCIDGEKPAFPQKTHAGETVRCDDKLPCARGLVCMDSPPNYCTRPTVIQSEGEPCFPDTQVQRQCSAGLTCRRRRNGTAGLLLCRK